MYARLRVLLSDQVIFSVRLYITRIQCKAVSLSRTLTKGSIVFPPLPPPARRRNVTSSTLRSSASFLSAAEGCQIDIAAATASTQPAASLTLGIHTCSPHMKTTMKQLATSKQPERKARKKPDRQNKQVCSIFSFQQV